MAYCGNCGADVGTNRFCTRCGTPVEHIAVQPMNNQQVVSQPMAGLSSAPVVQMNAAATINALNEQKKVERLMSMEEADRLVYYFGAKKAQYEEYDKLNEKLDRISRVTSVGPMVWGIIMMAGAGMIAFYSFVMVMATLSVKKGNGLGIGGGFALLLYLTMALGLFAGGYLLAKSNSKRNEELKKQVKTCEARIAELGNELSAYYEAYGYCPVGAEYTNPDILIKIRDVIRQGRASSIDMAINVMLDDVHKTYLELQAQMTARAARQAANGAAAAAAFSAASFFL